MIINETKVKKKKKEKRSIFFFFFKITDYIYTGE